MSLRLLVVDDDFDVLGIVTEYLGALGYDVVSALTGAEAVAKIRAAGAPFAAAVIDWTIPDIPGREVIRHLREHHPRCPVVVTTGHSADVVSDALAGQHATAVLRKPFTMRSLAMRVEAMVSPLV